MNMLSGLLIIAVVVLVSSVLFGIVFSIGFYSYEKSDKFKKIYHDKFCMHRPVHIKGTKYPYDGLSRCKFCGEKIYMDELGVWRKM